MIYEIQHRIETLAQNAVLDENVAPSFSLLDICFSHWEFNYRDGWSHNYWLAIGTIEASNFNDAYNGFRAKLAKIIPRVALIGQCYVESVSQPFLIRRTDRDVAFLNYSRDTKGVGLMFGAQELKALRLLLENSQIPVEFYYYWVDAVNSFGYSSKLLIMFSALEALFKSGTGKQTKDEYYTKIERVLGPDLKTELYGTKDNPNAGLRQRLVHGEYLSADDTSNYVELIHKRLISYFNDYVFKEKLIEENVVNPQRHFFGNTLRATFFIRAKEGKNLNLKDVLSEKDINNLENYESVYDDTLSANY
jgi:hypothetical protein